MPKNARNNSQSLRARAGNFVSRHASKIGVGALALGASGAASAQDSGLGAAALAALGGLQGDVKAILIILVGCVFLFTLYSFIKKAH